jgi:uncharacterized membrane protein YcjF (UPF0283 family)
MPQRYIAWSGALTVMVITAVLVVLDISDDSVQRYWSRHSFTSSVLAGLLVLLFTVLIVDRVTRMRQLRNQSRAIGAQAAIIVAQAKRAADAITSTSSNDDAREEASDELRTYTQMLLTSAPVLIDAAAPRTFLEAAQRVAARLFQTLRDAGDGRLEPAMTGLDDAIEHLQGAAAPLLAALNREQRTAVSSDEVDPRG